MMKKKLHRQKGAMFGLDARITMLIIAILGLVIYPVMNGVISKARTEAILATTKSVTLAIESFITDTGTTPATIDMLYDTVPTKAHHSKNWNGPYLKGNKNDRFVPALEWVVEDNDCTNAGKSSSYCSLRVKYKFCQFPQKVYDKLVDYYSADQAISYDSGTKCIIIDYGYAKTGVDETYASFKVKELP